MEKIISHRIGSSFALPIIIVGMVAIAGGIISAFEQPILGIGIALVGGFVSSSAYGSQLDLENRRYREYSSFFGIRTGEWKPMDKMPFISILSGKSGYTVYSMSNRATSDVSNHYEVCLLNESHRRKFVVQKFRLKKEAMEYSEILSSKTGKTIVQYNPAISEKSRKNKG